MIVATLDSILLEKQKKELIPQVGGYHHSSVITINVFPKYFLSNSFVFRISGILRNFSKVTQLDLLDLFSSNVGITFEWLKRNI